jgi:hypothetical protein
MIERKKVRRKDRMERIDNNRMTKDVAKEKEERKRIMIVRYLHCYCAFICMLISLLSFPKPESARKYVLATPRHECGGSAM